MLFSTLSICSGTKKCRVTIAACTLGRTAGCVTLVKLAPEGIDGGKFVAQSVRIKTVLEKWWPIDELAFAQAGSGGGSPLPIGAGEPIRVLDVHVPGLKDVDGKETFIGKWRTTPTIRYTSEPEGASQPGEAKKLSLERLFDRVQLEAIIRKLRQANPTPQPTIHLPAQTYPYLRLMMEGFAASMQGGAQEEEGCYRSSEVREVLAGANPGLGAWM